MLDIVEEVDSTMMMKKKKVRWKVLDVRDVMESWPSTTRALCRDHLFEVL